MYSNKENVNILTSLLVEHGVRRAVVCPGSRNAAIVHNLNECPQITCYPVTDERSASFYALGMCLAEDSPVVICVTSGTALLNVLPAVAEAFYQNQPLIVVSADRPEAFIGQLEGQTLPQVGALGSFVRATVNLKEPQNAVEKWHCNRLVNEALCACRRQGGGPVHLNVPLDEPLFNFNVPSLPEERAIKLLKSRVSHEAIMLLSARLKAAKRPMIVVGQLTDMALNTADINALSQHILVISEPLCRAYRGAIALEKALKMVGFSSEYMPDFILYAGGTLVSKRLKLFLQKTRNAETWTVDAGGEAHDTFRNLRQIIEGLPADVFHELAKVATGKPTPFLRLWRNLLEKAALHTRQFRPPYSQMLAVKRFEELAEPDAIRHYANSMSVRLGGLFAAKAFYCNRGVNGIEGSLSTAAGHSVATEKRVYCIIGDLSFFYDQNALWSQNITSNLRILLLNNGGGVIFRKLKGLGNSPAAGKLVAAEHKTTAQGICLENDIVYLSARNEDEMEVGFQQLISTEVERPVLLEVFTNPEEDQQVLDEYFS